MEVKDANGKPVQLSTKMRDRESAERYYTVYMAEKVFGITPKNKEVKTVKDAMLKWYEEKAGEKRSIGNDKQRGDWWIEQIGNTPLTKLGVRIVDETIEAKRKKDGIGDATSNRYLSLLRSVVNRAERKWGWIERAPRFALYPEPEGRDSVLELEQIPKLLGELPEHLRDMVTFSLATGLRTSNVTKAKWEWIDLKRKQMTVPVDSFKTKRNHTIPLVPTAVEVLVRQLGKHPERVFTYKLQRKNCEPRYVPVGKIRTAAWHKALARAEIKDFRPHDLRHTFATHHIRKGTPLVTLQALGGWKDPSMVQRYAHQNADSMRGYEHNSCV